MYGVKRIVGAGMMSMCLLTLGGGGPCMPQGSSSIPTPG
jgi:hypothetical protein